MEADEYLKAVISATPAAMLRPESSRWNMAGSSSSIAETTGLGGTITPTLSRRNNSNPFARAMEGFGTLTRSTGGSGVIILYDPHVQALWGKN